MAKNAVKENAEAVAAVAKTTAKAAKVVGKKAKAIKENNDVKVAQKEALEDGIVTQDESDKIAKEVDEATKASAEVQTAKAEFKDIHEVMKKEVAEAAELDKEIGKDLIAKIKAFFKKIFRK